MAWSLRGQARRSAVRTRGWRHAEDYDSPAGYWRRVSGQRRRERGQNVVSEGVDARDGATAKRAKPAKFLTAEEGSRTPTPLRAEDFESSASASSATSARAPA